MSGTQRERKRQHIRRHAGDVARRLGAGCDRHADHHVVGHLQAMQQNGCGRDQKPRQIGAGTLCCGAERGDLLLRQMRGGTKKIRRMDRRTLAERKAAGLRNIRQRAEPVVPVCRGQIRRAIGRIVFEQRRVRPESILANVLRARELRINRGGSAREQPHSVAVCDEVVIARVPEEPPGRNLEQRELKQRPVHRVDRASPCRPASRPARQHADRFRR